MGSGHVVSDEFLIGVELRHTNHKSQILRGHAMPVRTTLKRAPVDKGLQCGPVRFHTNGTLSISGKRLSLKDVPDRGMVIDGVRLLRSGDDLVGVLRKERLFVFSYSSGCWYHGEPQRS